MSQIKPLILICNDDGIHALGIRVLAEKLSAFAQVYMVAPLVERSASSHCITIHDPLRVEKLDPLPFCSNVYGTSGSPADCVMLAIDQILPKKPDLVISGINRGGNLGSDTLYSGTVAAAMEGAMAGVASMAVSTVAHFQDRFHYDTAASVALDLANGLLANPLDTGSMLNVNVPNLPLSSIKGVLAASIGSLKRSKSFLKNSDPVGRSYYWLAADGHDFEDLPGSDCNLVDQGYVTVSVLKPTFFCRQGHDKLAENLKGYHFSL